MTRVFSGIQPSGELHIGNYLGAVQNWVQLQHQHDCLFSIVDLHAITQPYDVATLAQRTLDMAVGLYASGLDPEKCIVFVQSHVAEHSELNWLLTIVAPLGELERQTQFKDKSQRQESIPAGLLNYPVLQAADVLLYKARLVPVGEDQVQHLELMREIARRWNARFGAGYFPEPQPLLTKSKRVLGLDGQAKMSKIRLSGNHLGEAAARRHRSGPQDPQGPGQPRHLQHLHDPPGLLARGDADRRRAQVPHRGLGLPRLQTRAGGQYDSGAHSHPRAGRGVAA